MTLKFNPFNPHGKTIIHHRNLPHWQQDGATYFVTFRLADSIPRHLAAQWNHERRQWLAARGLADGMDPEARAQAYRTIDKKQRRNFERQNARRLFMELDQCRGTCLLKEIKARDILSESMKFHDGERYHSGDFVIMPNHVHWIVQPMDSHRLEKILQSIKRFSSTRFTKEKIHPGRLWQSESHDRIIRDRAELDRIRKYIGNNPHRAHLPPSHYLHESADWLNES
ncbi:MAG: transposase [Verrucomicrobia bacterium]|nr:transposase [Verrucomicrobiota bacterium]